MRNLPVQLMGFVTLLLLSIAAHSASLRVLAQAPEAFEVASIKPLGEANAAALARYAFGLKLESAKVPAEIIVIDRAERPSEN
jgi:hypothetical protein